ncbi:MAG: hypothetical protein JJU28_13230 [Cyclobacteriaceae bacterium]|nr:hypothetical protein [Cyclobacteriaceae bacterium]
MYSFGKLRYIICGLFTGICILLPKNLLHASNTDHYELIHYTLKSGLSNFHVNSVVRDPWGFVWIATAYGLNRYDGEFFETFYQDESEGPCGNHIKSLAIDDQYRLWIGTEQDGICYYDLKSGKFNNLSSLVSADYIRQMELFSVNSLLYHNNSLWIATYRGLYLLDLTNNTLINLSDRFPGLINENGDLVVYDIKLSQNGQILIGTSMGMGWIDEGLEHFLVLSFPNDHGLYVTDILCDVNGYHWVATRGGGLLRVGISDLEVSRVEWMPEDAIIWSLARDTFNRIWMGDNKGLKVYDLTNKDFVSIAALKINKQALEGVGFISMYADQDGFIWSGTYAQGLYMFNPYASPFYLLNESTDQTAGLSFNSVLSLNMINDSIAAVGTRAAWLYFVDTKSWKVVRKISLNQKWQYQGDVLAIEKVNDNELLIGTYRFGLVLCDMQGNIIRRFTRANTNGSLADDDIRTIFPAGNGKYWVGTNEAGLHLYDHTKGIIEWVDPWKFGNGILKIVPDHIGGLWMASYSGLKYFHPDFEDKSRNLSYVPGNRNSISGNHVTDLVLVRSNLLCIGTYGGGLNLYDIDSDSFIQYNEKDGLSSNIITGILNDKNGNLWISTSSGISLFSLDSLKFINFGSSDGLNDGTFNFRAYTMNADGYILKGSSRGLVYFKPEEIYTRVEPTRPAIREFRINGKIFPFNKYLLDYQEKVISMDYDRSDVSIAFSALNFTRPEDIQFYYRLLPNHEDWISINKSRILSLSALAPGSYTLQMKAVDRSEMDIAFDPVQLYVKPPFWDSLWFKILILLFIAAILFVLFLYKTHQTRKINGKLSKLVRERTRKLSKSNKKLKKAFLQIQNQKDEIQAQNEELLSQNEEIMSQRDNLEQQRNELEVVRLQLDQSNKKLQNLNTSLENKVIKRTERLLKVNTELDRFVYSASHELVSPLKSVNGLLNLIEKDPVSSNQETYFQLIKGSIAKLENLVKNLLEYSRNSNISLEYGKCNLHALVADILEDNKFLNVNVVLENEIHKDVAVYTDQRRIKIVLGNIITNAIKYADLNKASPYVKLQHVAENGYHKISIEDNGTGIPVDYQDKLFDMYFRVDTGVPGSGLGLYISKEIVSKLKGYISMNSKPGIGSVFTVHLPTEFPSD